MPKLEQWFDSVETDQPFESCVVCRNVLRFSADSWVVNKHYHRAECIMEYAVCETCRDDVSSNFSEQSKTAIRHFLENEIDWEARMLDWMALLKTEQRFDNCVACRAERELLDGFTISAQFRHDGSLVDGALPLLLCSHCIARITDNLSGESKETWQNFISEHIADSGDMDFGIF
ncbi:MAG: hypothetical protein ACSHX7_02000 [Luteolibacter sp.]